jgi:hypothetical protein
MVDSNGDGLGRWYLGDRGANASYDEAMHVFGLCLRSNLTRAIYPSRTIPLNARNASAAGSVVVPNVTPFTFEVDTRGYAIIDGVFHFRLEANTSASVVVTAHVLRTKHEVSTIYNYNPQARELLATEDYHLEVLPQGKDREILMVYTVRKRARGASAATWSTFVSAHPSSDCTVSALRSYEAGQSFSKSCFPQKSDITERDYMDFDYRMSDDELVSFRFTKIPDVAPTVTNTYDDTNMRNALWGLFAVAVSAFVFAWMVESTKKHPPHGYVALPSDPDVGSGIIGKVLRVDAHEHVRCDAQVTY